MEYSSTQLFCTSPSLFILEPAIHIEEIDGYDIFAHNPDEKEITYSIQKALKSKSLKVKVTISPIRRKNPTAHDFKKQCLRYFERNFEVLAQVAPLILPWKKPFELKSVVDAMSNWCTETNKLSVTKGLVLHSFFIFPHLKLYGYTEKTLLDSFKIENISKTQITVVYNPSKNSILLIRKAESEKLEDDIALAFIDLKMFILLFDDELKGSSMKLIPLVLTNEKINLDSIQLYCDLCKNHVLSKEDLTKFELWFEFKHYFEPDTKGEIREDFSKAFLAKVTSITAATYIYPTFVPIFTDMEMMNLKVLLTPEQMEIFYSQHKHIIIKGGFGCGKTIVSAAVLEKISEKLEDHQKLYYICYDSRSPVRNDMIRDKGKVTVVHNKKGHKLSELIKDIVKKEKNAKEVNFVVDEYDSEDLKESEAARLNDIFSTTAALKEASILLNVQPIEKERAINNTKQKGNMFELLTTMKTYQLTLSMRNSVEIHKLVETTKNVLSKEKTIFTHQKDDETDVEKNTTEVNQEKQEHLPAAESSPQVADKSKVEKIDFQQDSEEILKLGLDEAHAVLESLQGTAKDGTKTVSTFKHVMVEKTGHNIKTKKPGLLELGDYSEVQKISPMIALLKKLAIEKKDHVVLHFDTVTIGIPSILKFILENHFKLIGKVTTKYEEFRRGGKSILICGYAKFRGLEHANITVLVDRNIYFVQHYLVEALARCTSELNVVVLQNSEILTKVIKEWKSKDLVSQEIIDLTLDNEDYERLKLEFNNLSKNNDETARSEDILSAKKTIRRKR